MTKYEAVGVVGGVVIAAVMMAVGFALNSRAVPAEQEPTHAASCSPRWSCDCSARFAEMERAFTALTALVRDQGRRLEELKEGR